MTVATRTTFILSFFLPFILLAPSASAVEPEGGTFSDTWRRTDLPVRQGNAERTWIWGPEANTFVQWEPYAEARDGLRLVQYFDKARMEDNSFRGGLPWEVTTGLLVVEMMTGEVQIGDGEFAPGRSPASINVAGDPGASPSSPTYASLTGLRSWADIRTDEGVSERVNRAGEVSADPSLAERGVTMVHFDGTTGHNIAAPFWEFMNSTGPVDINGDLDDDLLFPNPFFAVGRPITEPYWATIPVAGTEKDVLLQCFERRCLTYTADNPEGWQVEAGNVGAHYYAWRYGEPQGQIAFSHDGNIWIMDGNGTNPRQVTDAPEHESGALWSPNGTQLLFVRSIYDPVTIQQRPELWGVDLATGEERYLASLGQTRQYPIPSFDWSSDGRQVVASDGGVIEIIDFASGEVVQRYGDLGFIFDLNWSPTERLILFRSEFSSPSDDRTSGIYELDLASNQIAHLPGTTISDKSPEWSPDSTKIIVQTFESETSHWNLYLLGPEGGEKADRILIAQEVETVRPRWSPSGDLIAYVAHDQIRVVDVSDLDSEHWTMAKVSEFDFPRSLAWAPDSTSVAANVAYYARTVWAFNLSSELHNLAAVNADGPDWIP